MIHGIGFGVARFDGGWGASGDGTINGVASEWKTTEIADIVLNVTLPD